ncbi:MAG: PAS domain-containing sensor histidine kinase, partial [Candidatus Thorarchaeota archaeon]
DGILKRELAARLLLEQVTDGIHIYTNEGRIIYANEAPATRLGYAHEELLKLHPADIDISANDFPEIRAKLITQGHALYETKYITRDGRKIESEVNSNMVQYYGEEAVLTISRDVSHRLSVIDRPEIYVLKNELVRSNRDLELYTSILQHDLRSDLQVVLTQTDISEFDSLASPREIKSLKVIQAAIERMSNLLDMLKTTENVTEQELERCILARASEARIINPDVRIDIVNTIGSEMTHVSAGGLLPLVWTNLIRNAINFSGSETRISIIISRKMDKVIVDVADNGPGVSDEIKNHLFEKGVSTTGSGYGLYLCRKIVEAYGGSIELVNQEQGGARFRVTLIRS